MYESYNLYYSSGGKKYKATSIDTLIGNYKCTSNNKIKGQLYAGIFCNLFPMILKISRKYNELSYAQKAEYTDLCLMNSLKNYKPNSRTKFTSYFYGNLSRCFLGFQKAQKECNKKKIWSMVISPSNDEYKNYLLTNISSNSGLDHIDFLDAIQNSSILDNEEKEYCRLLTKGFYKTSDMIAVFNPFNISVNKKRNELKKLRENLKEKIKNNNFELF